MTIKQTMLAIMFFISVDNFAIMTDVPYSKGFVFNKGMNTRIKGNDILDYIFLHRKQDDPSYVFKHTRVIESTKDKQLTEVGTLGSFEKVYRINNSPYICVLNTSASETNKSSIEASFLYSKLCKFQKFARMNNAVYCDCIEQKLNYFDKLEDVGAIIYGTQDVEDCGLLKEYLKQQELAKSAVKAAENK